MIKLREWVYRASLMSMESDEDIQSRKRGSNQWQNDLSNETDKTGGFTPLHYASYYGNHKMIDMLVSAGADVYAVNDQGINMIHVAA